MKTLKEKAKTNVSYCKIINNKFIDIKVIDYNDVKEAILELEEKLINKLVINKTFEYQYEMESVLFTIQDTIQEIFGDFEK